MTKLETANLNTQLHLYSEYKEAIVMAQSTQRCEIEKVLRIVGNPKSKDASETEYTYTKEQANEMFKILGDLLQPPSKSYLERYLNTANDRRDLINRLNQ